MKLVKGSLIEVPPSFKFHTDSSLPHPGEEATNFTSHDPRARKSELACLWLDSPSKLTMTSCGWQLLICFSSPSSFFRISCGCAGSCKPNTVTSASASSASGKLLPMASRTSTLPSQLYLVLAYRMAKERGRKSPGAPCSVPTNLEKMAAACAAEEEQRLSMPWNRQPMMLLVEDWERLDPKLLRSSCNSSSSSRSQLLTSTRAIDGAFSGHLRHPSRQALTTMEQRSAERQSLGYRTRERAGG
mmetsp:Transcript_26822/g.87806  ORF Transcript_26822/g.87806 Transcript_26822/m.87806 type:complete len:244 (+) Transcript_26822:143-874(+)